MDSQALLGQLTEYDKNRKNSVDVLNEAMGKYGIPEMRSRVSGLRTTLANTESALNAVDPSVTGRTQGSLVTEAQRQRQVANERAPITEQYGQQARALDTESGNMSSAMSAAKLLADNTINDWNAGRNALQSRYDITYQREQQQKAEAEAAAARRAAAAQAASYFGGASGGQVQTGGGAASRPSLASFDTGPDVVNPAKRGVAQYQINGQWYDQYGDRVDAGAANKQQTNATKQRLLIAAANPLYAAFQGFKKRFF